MKLTTTNVYTRRSCDVCGGCTEKVAVLAEATDETGNVVFRVCETCLEAGDIDRRLAARADALAAHAEWSRSLVGRVTVPTFAEWTAMVERADIAYFAACHTPGPDDDGDAEYQRVMTDDAAYAKWRAREREWKIAYDKECDRVGASIPHDCVVISVWSDERSGSQ